MELAEIKMRRCIFGLIRLNKISEEHSRGSVKVGSGYSNGIEEEQAKMVWKWVGNEHC